MSTSVEHQAVQLGASIPDDAEIEKKLQTNLRRFRDRIDSPKTLLIIRNAVLTLLEVGDEVEDQMLSYLLADKDYRDGVVNRLSSQTPEYWDESWSKAWVKEIEPLYSKAQQRIARRRSLLSFWTKEWDTLPAEQVKHALEALLAK